MRRQLIIASLVVLAMGLLTFLAGNQLMRMRARQRQLEEERVTVQRLQIMLQAMQQYQAEMGGGMTPMATTRPVEPLMPPTTTRAAFQPAGGAAPE